MRDRDARDTRTRARCAAGGGGRRRAGHDRARRRRGRRAGRRPGARARPGMSARAPSVAVVGFPNVGKSTLVNRLAGGREAVTDAEAGVTRDRKRLPCEWNGLRFSLIDTGGIDLDDAAELARDRSRSRRRRRSPRPTSIVLVVDAPRRPARRRHRAGRDPARHPSKPVVVAVNKVDRPGDDGLTAASSTGSGSASRWQSPPATGSAPATCSTAWSSCSRRAGGGEDDEGIVRDRGDRAAERRQVLAASTRCSATSRVIVSERAGTTRDSIDTELEVDGAGSCWSTPPACGAVRRSPGPSTTTRSCAPSRRPSGPTSPIVVCDATEGRHLRGSAGRRAGDDERLRDACSSSTSGT